MESVKFKVGQILGVATYAGSDRFDGYRVVAVTPDPSFPNLSWSCSIGLQHVKTGKVLNIWSPPEFIPCRDLKLIEDVP